MGNQTVSSEHASTNPCAIPIIHEDRDMIIIDKPPELLSVPGRGEDKKDSVLTRMEKMYDHVWAVNRLDFSTSGLMVLALRRKAESNLKQQFQDRQVKKRYTAIVEGLVEQGKGTINFPLVYDPAHKPRQKVCYKTGKPALTTYEVLYRENKTTAMYLYPYTGRSHQLRVHCMTLGHPIVGDRLYGSNTNTIPSQRLLLHAEQLTLNHPYSGKPCTFFSPAIFLKPVE